jgi:hypothetical protein
MRPAHPLTGLITVVPNVLRRSKDAGQPLRLFAFVEGEPLGSSLPRGLRDDLKFVGARRATVFIKPGRESLQGAFRKARLCRPSTFMAQYGVESRRGRQRNKCPPEKRSATECALRYFGMMKYRLWGARLTLQLDDTWKHCHS